MELTNQVAELQKELEIFRGRESERGQESATATAQETEMAVEEVRRPLRSRRKSTNHVQVPSHDSSCNCTKGCIDNGDRRWNEDQLERPQVQWRTGHLHRVHPEESHRRREVQLQLRLID